MSTDQSCTEVDIVSGVLIDTQYPVEKFLVKWRVSNYSKIFNTVEAEFSTTSKSTLFRLKLYKGEITLWMYSNILSNIRVHYQSIAKNSCKTYQDVGSFTFKRIFDHCSILKIPLGIYNEYKVTFENDVLNFECTMTIFGHTITRNVPLQIAQCFTSKQITDDFEQLFLSKKDSDVIISDGKNKIPAHKIILCSRSPVFNAMFQHSMVENASNEVEIEDIDFDIVKVFLLFLYSGNVKDLSWDSAMSLYYAADKYEVEDLRDICSDYLQNNLTPETACSVLKLADQHKDHKLLKSVVFFIEMHTSSVKLTEGWKDLIRTHPKILTEFYH